MQGKPKFIEIAELIGEPSRATMLFELLSGRSLPASELAHACRITPQTASAHLAKLVEGGLLSVDQSGRHRYYRLANPEVAHLLEAMNMIAPQKPVSSLRESDQVKKVRFARTCYDHLAGAAGVALTDRFVHLGYIVPAEKDFELTAEGAGKMIQMGIDIDALRKAKRHFARPCLDWSERKHHLAGGLGAAITNRLMELDWIRRYPEGRAVQITESGREGLYREFGLTIRES